MPNARCAAQYIQQSLFAAFWALAVIRCAARFRSVLRRPFLGARRAIMLFNVFYYRLHSQTFFCRLPIPICICKASPHTVFIQFGVGFFQPLDSIRFFVSLQTEQTKYTAGCFASGCFIFSILANYLPIYWSNDFTFFVYSGFWFSLFWTGDTLQRQLHR